MPDLKPTAQNGSPQLSHREMEFLRLVPDAYIAVDASRHVQIWNTAAAELYGWTMEEATGKELNALLTSEYIGCTGDEIQRALETEGKWAGEIIQTTRDGTCIHVAATETAIKGPDGRLSGMVAVYHDVTSERQTERSLREAESRLRHLYTHTPAMLHSIDRGGRIVEVSEQWLEVLGYTRDEVVGRKSTEFLSERSRKYADDVALPDFFLKGTANQVPYEFVAKDGRVIEVLLSATSELDQDGEFLRSLAVLDDVTERNRAERELRQSEEKHRRVFRQAGIGIGVYDTDLKIESYNDVAARSMGMKPEDLVGKTLAELFGETAAAAYESRLKLCLESGKSRAYEDPIELQGARGWFLSTYQRLVNDDGNPVGVQIQSVDVTDRKLAELKAEEMRAHYEALVEDLPEIILETDLDANILFSNSRGLEVFGYSEAELLSGINAFDIIAPEDHDRAASNLSHRRQGQRIGSVRYTAVRKDGSTLPILLNVRIIETDGKPSGFRGIVVDLSEQVKTEEAALQSEARLREVLDNSPFPVAVVDESDHHILYWSKTARALFGHTPDTTAEWYELAYPDPEYRREVLDRWRPLLEQARESGASVNTGEYRIRCSDGSVKICELHAQFIPGNLIVSMNVITQRRLAEKERERLEPQLRQSQKMEAVGRLAGGVAHDFNNFLMGIMNYAELSRDSISPDHPSRKWLDEITREAERSAQLTRQLLAFARKQTISPQALDMNDAVERMLSMLRRLIGEDIELIWKPAPEPAATRIDPGQLDQILANLCINGRDAIQGAGTLTIETHSVSIDAEFCSGHPDATPGEYVLLTVRDNGKGMDAETIEQVFEPFFTTKDAGEGTGLGLATVYGIVRQNSGFVTVESAPSHGTTFGIYLPQVREASEVAAVKSETAPRGGNETILLVEDEAAIRETVSILLERLGYEVHSASKPAMALELASKHTGEIHLLITDVVMPGMTGRDLAEQLVETNRSMKVLHISGYPADVIAHQGILDEGVTLLSKPISSNDLAQAVRLILDE